MHISIPMVVGNAKVTKVQYLLPVSFFAVKRAVEQGQCIRENTTVQMAVFMVHPLPTSRFLSSESSE